MKGVFIFERYKAMNDEAVYFYIETKEDELKWKEFLSHYFPNHYASSVLKEELAGKHGRIGLDINGYGWLSLLCAHYGNFKKIKDFEEFKTTKCYQMIVKRGVTLEVGEPSVVSIDLNKMFKH